MFGMESLDMLIGLVTVYLMFALATTAVVESVSTWFKLRSKTLVSAMSELLKGKVTTEKGDVDFVQAFYAHPMVQILSRGDNGRPSYIDSRTVADVVTSIVTGSQVGGAIADSIKAMPGSPGDNRVKDLLSQLSEKAQGEVEKFKLEVMSQFDVVMDRASGWMKQKAQRITVVISLVLVVGSNADTFTIANSLSTNPQVKAALISAAQNQVSFDAPEYQNLAGLQLGWSSCPCTVWEWIQKIFGLSVTVLAVSLGAPFWFQLLQKFMNIRSSKQIPTSLDEQNTKSKKQKT